MAEDSKIMSSADVEDTHSVKIGEVASANIDVAAAYAHHLEGENAYTRKGATHLRWKLDLRHHAGRYGQSYDSYGCPVWLPG